MATEMAANHLQGTYHRRELPPPSIAFASSEGKQVFKEALIDGYTEGYFRLAEHFTTQGHPSFCGLGSLTMALNSLFIDPERVWQGVWRWFDDTMLDCCEPLDLIKLKGITLAKLACLARCNGADVTLKYGDQVTIEEFEEDLIKISTQTDPVVMITAYSRQALKQSGIGHFSPIAAYHPGRQMALIMDVARFKYPPHWVPLASLYSALLVVDTDSGRCRGYMMLTPSPQLHSHCFCDGSSSVQSDCSSSAASSDLDKIMDSSDKEAAKSSGTAKIAFLLSHECPHCASSSQPMN